MVLFIKNALSFFLSIRIGTTEEWKKVGVGSFLLIFTLSTAIAISPEFRDGTIDFVQSFGRQSTGPSVPPMNISGEQLFWVVADLASVTR